MWRSDDEMHQAVVPGAWAGGRRRLVGAGVAAALVLVTAIAAVVVRLPDEGRDRAQFRVAASGAAVSAGPTTSAALAAEPTTDEPTTTAMPATTVVEHPPAAVTTVAAPAPAGDDPVTTSTTAAFLGCSPSDARATTTVDKPTYLPGQPVRISSTLENVSGRTCEGGSLTLGNSLEITNAAGGRVYVMPSAVMHGDCFVVSPACSWPAGRVETTAGCWDQTDGDTHAQVPPGTYTATVRWIGPVGGLASATFQIVPDPAAPTTIPATGCPRS